MPLRASFLPDWSFVRFSRLPLRVKTGSPHSEHMFSGMPRIAAASEPCWHLRSAPEAAVGSISPSLGTNEKTACGDPSKSDHLALQRHSCMWNHNWLMLQPPRWRTANRCVSNRGHLALRGAVQSARKVLPTWWSRICSMRSRGGTLLCRKQSALQRASIQLKRYPSWELPGCLWRDRPADR
jgi:hypothetical protein